MIRRFPNELEHRHSSVLTDYDDTPGSSQYGGVPSHERTMDDVVEHEHQQQLFFVSSYSDFDKLAHGPRGKSAKHTLRTYRFQDDGSLVLLSVGGEGSSVINPAFSRFHPRLNVIYTCTEDIEDNGQILAYEVHHDGSLTELCRIDAGGTSTCYLTIDREHRHLIAVNYWDSTLVVIPLSRETGEFAGPVQNVYDPRAGKKMITAAKKNGGVNHSNNDSSTIAMRQVDPHSHALVLDPFEGCVAYVPDLGKDLIREIFYDNKKGALGLEFNVLPSGMSTGMPDGPRYIDFHPKINVAYVVNELSSTIAVYSVDRELLGEISRAEKLGLPLDRFHGRSTLRLIQSIKTVPSAFPITMNTCGRICVHQTGRFVIVSNRGHESITIFRVKQSCGGSKGRAIRGTLSQVGFFHTRGETPRHFQFDHSGQFLIVANQDSDTIAVFSFNLTSGEIKYTGHEYRVPSPNFVCCCPMVDRYSEHDVEASEGEGYAFISSLESGKGGRVPTSVEFDLASTTTPTNYASSDLQGQLELARKEIELLKFQISNITEQSA